MKIVLLVCGNITLKDICHNPEIFSNALESLTLKHFSLEVIPPSHRRPGATAVIVRHKPPWHRHDCRGSAVVPSLIAVAPRKTVKTATFAVARRKRLVRSSVLVYTVYTSSDSEITF